MGSRSCPTPAVAGGWICRSAAGVTPTRRSSTAAAAPPVAGGFTRAYLHYLLRAGELTGLRLVTLHNLSFIASVMADLRAGIEGGRLAEVADALSAGATPGADCMRRGLRERARGRPGHARARELTSYFVYLSSSCCI